MRVCLGAAHRSVGQEGFILHRMVEIKIKKNGRDCLRTVHFARNHCHRKLMLKAIWRP